MLIYCLMVMQYCEEDSWNLILKLFGSNEPSGLYEIM